MSDDRTDFIQDDGACSSRWRATWNEWLGLLDVAGLGLEALYGGFGGEPMTDDSREHVFVARGRRYSVRGRSGDLAGFCVAAADDDADALAGMGGVRAGQESGKGCGAARLGDQP